LGKDTKEFYSQASIQLGELKKTNPELIEILELYKPIFAAQRKVRRSFRPSLRGFDAEYCGGRTAKGLPLIEADDVEIDRSLLKMCLQDICRVIRDRQDKAIPHNFDVSSLSDQGSFLVSQFIEGGTGLEKLAGELDIAFDTFYFLLHQALIPFVSTYAEKLQSFVEPGNWLRGYCPICGSEPLMAKLEEETGRRLLYCSLCHTEWVFRRLVCPFCENEEQELLRYFFVDSNESHRVDVCDKCKRYIKTIDARNMYRVKNLFIEYLSTLALDVIADKEGFSGRATLLS
jgi:FdhE protein